jgi:hypothetical protein
MGVLQDFVKGLPWELDYGSVLDPDIEKIESAVYGESIIYKYLSEARRPFFDRPQVRFTQRAALNDPLEMARQWKSASTEPLRRIMRERFKDLFPLIRSDKSLLVRMLAEEIKSRGIALNAEQIGHLLSAPQIEQRVIAGLANAESTVSFMIDYVFGEVENLFQEQLDKLVSTWGILSLSERPLNDLMWAHYADEVPVS